MLNPKKNQCNLLNQPKSVIKKESQINQVMMIYIEPQKKSAQSAKICDQKKIAN
jgi:hypothetical protein